MMRKIVYITTILSLIIALSTNAGAIGLGVSPASITIEDALKGSTYEKTFTAYNTGNDSGIFTLNSTGASKDWITFYELNGTAKVESIEITAKGSKKLLVKFKIPADAANGVYNSTLYVQTTPSGSTQGGAVAQAVIRMPVKVSINVTGIQRLDGIVKSIKIRDTEVGYPIKIYVEFQNTGNVEAKPAISVDISKDGKAIDTFTSSKTSVKVDTTEIIQVEWNTTGREAGDYSARVGVSLDGKKLEEKTLSFKIYPPGTLTRQGNLTSIDIEGEPLVNRVIKIKGIFINTGQIDTNAKFSAEIYKDNELVDTIKSEELLVCVEKTNSFISYYKITSTGNYAIKGKIFYGNKETDVLEKQFSVANKSTPGFESFILISSVILISALIRKRVRKIN